MFDNTNPYTLRKEIVGGITRYYVSFVDGQSLRRETEISRPVYLQFCRFVREETKLRRRDERHEEQSALTDASLQKRALKRPKSLEETVFDIQINEQLQLAIQELPEIQRRRFVLCYEFGLTYEQIAQMEGRTVSPIKRSIDRAREKIRTRINLSRK